MKNLHKKSGNEKGSTLVFAAMSAMMAIACAALSIDIGFILTSQSELQNAVDAATLSGVSGLVHGNSEAIRRAISIGNSNVCGGRQIQMTAQNVSFPNPNELAVGHSMTVNLFFAPLLGMVQKRISAGAVGALGTIVGTNGLRPWAIPDRGYPTGAPVLLKPGSLGAPSTNPSFYYCVDYPPINRGTPEVGASVYAANIARGSKNEIFIKDEIQVEPGNMVGPTRQGIINLISQDPGAFWNGFEVVNSAFPGFASPRIVKIPLYDPNLPPDNGRTSITCVGLGAFFLQGMQGNNVVGVFMRMTTAGTFGRGYSFLKGAKLIK